MFRVIISDDHVMFATLMQMWLQQQKSENAPVVEIIAIVSTGADTLKAVREHKPDFLIQDIHLPDMNGVEIITILRAEMPDLKIFVLSGRADWARSAIEAGANGCMLKEDNPRVIQQILTWDINSGVWISPVLGEKFYRANKELMKFNFSASEQGIMRLLSLSNIDIANELHLSEGTIRNTISGIYQKTGLGTRAELSDWAQNVLLLTPPPNVGKKP